MKNWAIPISENQISFDVGGTQINQENIIKLLDENKKYLGDITSEYINFCIESRKKTYQLNSYSLMTDLQSQYHYSLHQHRWLLLPQQMIQLRRE